MPASPFDTLPSEVIERIFMLCAYQALSFMVPPRRPRHVDHINIASVCWRWRSIALHMPQFWGHHIILFILPFANHKLELECASMWLERARGAAISMDILTAPHDSSLELKVRDMLCTHKFRRMNVALSLFSLFFEDAAYWSSLSCLEELSLRWAQTYDPSPSSSDPYQLPCLQFLELDLQYLHDVSYKDALYMIPWQQMCRLKIVNGTISMVLEILRLCHSLTECVISFSPQLPDNQTASVVPSFFPRLRVLEIQSGSSLNDAATLLRALDSPNLDSFTLRTSESMDRFVGDFASVYEQLDSRFGALRSFITQVPMHDADFHRVLKLLPFMRDFAGPVPLGRGTAEKIANGDLGFHLETLDTGRNCDPEVMLDMIEKRQKHAKGDTQIRPFVKVRFGFPNYLLIRYQERARLLELGDVEIRKPHEDEGHQYVVMTWRLIPLRS